MASIDRQRVILGLGKTGLSYARYLQAKGMSFVVNDSRDSPPGLEELKSIAPNSQVISGGFDAQLLLEAKQIFISPGVAVNQPLIQQAKANGAEVLSDIGIFSQEVDKPIIAVTGSNGKSTVVDLLHQLIQAAGFQPAMGGNIGIPALDLLELKNIDFYVLELSSFQLEVVENLGLVSGGILNISADHMDRYESFAAYQQAKHRIYQHCQCLVINMDDKSTLPAEIKMQQSIMGFSIEEKEHFDKGLPAIEKIFSLQEKHGQLGLYQNETFICHTASLKLKALHNYANMLAALALLVGAGIEISAGVVEQLKNYQGLPYRCQHIKTKDNIAWFNDSKATNVGATLAAIKSFAREKSGQIILLAGGDGKGVDFNELSQPIEDHVIQLIVFGKDGGEIAKEVDTIPTFQVDDLEMAVNKARQVAREYDVVLLSPACSSLDMFENFEHRGQVFNQYVEALA